MTRTANTTPALVLLLLLLLMGCRAAAPSVAEATPEPPVPTPTRPVELVELVEVVETPKKAPEIVALGRGATTYVVPPGVGASVTACEQSCGEVHDCALLERMYTPATAAAIELGCVRACLSTPERATLFGCGRPPAIEPGTCGPFLACIDSAWPREGGSQTVIDPPTTNLPTDPCARVCDAFARCWDPSTTPELIEQCAEQCREALDAEEERKFGSCADLPECADIMTCVAGTPNAT